MSSRSLFITALPALLAVLAAGGWASTKEVRKQSEIPTPVIDINQASVEDFQKLKGIGPALARRIVAFREKHGPFRRVEDLLAIRGIGPKKWKALRPYLRVGNLAGRGAG